MTAFVFPPPLDKQAHFFSGGFLALALLHVLPVIYGLTIALVVVMLIVATIAALKEWYDYRHPLTHSCDIYDWVATSSGGVVGCLLVAGAHAVL